MRLGLRPNLHHNPDLALPNLQMLTEEIFKGNTDLSANGKAMSAPKKAPACMTLTMLALRFASAVSAAGVSSRENPKAL